MEVILENWKLKLKNMQKNFNWISGRRICKRRRLQLSEGIDRKRKDEILHYYQRNLSMWKLIP